MQKSNERGEVRKREGRKVGWIDGRKLQSSMLDSRLRTGREVVQYVRKSTGGKVC